MFGYFRPYSANLTKREQTLFNSHYCRICYCLRAVGGQMARFCTTYDGALYSLVLSLDLGIAPPPHLPCERIGRKNTRLFAADELGMRLSHLSLINFGEKFRDDRLDGNKSALRNGALSLIFGRAIKKSQAAEPEIARITREGTDEINRLQAAGAPLPEIFGAYGDVAERSFLRFGAVSLKGIRLLRAIAEWNFLVDMTVDYAEDYESGAYNGFKTEGLPTFPAYFDRHYTEYLATAGAATDRLVSALLAMQCEDVTFYTLYKIITHATDTVLPAAIAGKDVGFHYFRDLRDRTRENRRLDRDLKRLGMDKK